MARVEEIYGLEFFERTRSRLIELNFDRFLPKKLDEQSNDAILNLGLVLERIESSSKIRFRSISCLIRFAWLNLNSGFLENFMKLPESQQSKIISEYKDFNRDSVFAYVLALQISGSSNAVLLMYDLSNFKEFREVSKVHETNYVDPWGFESDPMDNYSSRFRDVALDFSKKADRFKRGDFTLIFLLREIYGENQTLEVFERNANESQNLNLMEILRLLQNWNELKEYPLSWSRTLIEK